MNIPDLLTAFTIGLVGSAHCFSMCGGVASMLSSQTKNHPISTPLFYNLGRIISYSVMGALVGGALAVIATLSDLKYLAATVRLISGVFLILLAFYIAQWWNGLASIEKLGHKIWRRLQPYASSMLPIKSPMGALPFGMLWGWLPCGLVYSSLSWAATSGNWLSGASIMFAFGLGTLPAMIFVGVAAKKVQSLRSSSIFKNIAGVLILAYAVFIIITTLMMLINMGGGMHHHH
ncbi:sulfite exporter TauE/SafE family protein [Vibrio sp.]|nr:sulfite exporter TauE/SafE family protein [Vibrio sp.]